MRTTAKLFASGKVTIPAQIREELDITDGDLVELDVHAVSEEQ